MQLLLHMLLLLLLLLLLPGLLLQLRLLLLLLLLPEPPGCGSPVYPRAVLLLLLLLLLQLLLLLGLPCPVGGAPACARERVTSVLVGDAVAALASVAAACCPFGTSQGFPEAPEAPHRLLRCSWAVPQRSLSLLRLPPGFLRCTSASSQALLRFSRGSSGAPQRFPRGSEILA